MHECFPQDGFDVEGFIEMLAAYLPEIEDINHSLVCEWIFELSAGLSAGKVKQVKGKQSVWIAIF